MRFKKKQESVAVCMKCVFRGSSARSMQNSRSGLKVVMVGQSQPSSGAKEKNYSIIASFNPLK